MPSLSKSIVGGCVSVVLGLPFDSTDELVHFLTNTMRFFFKNCECSVVSLMIWDGDISRNYFIIQYFFLGILHFWVLIGN